MEFDADKFWSLDDFLPEDKKSKGKKFDTETVEITIENDTAPTPDGDKIPPKKELPEETQKKLEIAREAMKKAFTASAEKSVKRSLGRDKKKSAVISDDFPTEPIYNADEDDEISTAIENNLDEDEENPTDILKTVAMLHKDDTEPPKTTEKASKVPTSEPPYSYVPENPLIKSVEISPWETHFAFHERFREDAVRYSAKKGKECEFAPFYSYSPSYIQLSPSQREYYLYFRDSVKQGVYLKTTMAYIILFFAEIVNTPSLTPPKEGVKYLCDLYTEYHKEFDFPSRILPQWILDYCFINKVTPTEKLCLAMSGVMSDTAWQIAGFRKDYNPIVSTVLSASGHDYKNSKTVTDENRGAFDKYVPTAAYQTIKEAIERGLKPFSTERKWYRWYVSSHPSFVGLTCAYEFKKNIKVESFGIIRSQEMCRFAAEVIEYAENKVRSLLGIKNRYHVTAVSDEIKSITDRLFRDAEPIGKKYKPVVRPEYEKLYDCDDTAISSALAKQIENDAWKIADLLTDNEDFAEEQITEPEPTSKACDDNGELALAIRAIRSLIGGDETFTEVAKDLNIFPDAFADGVNETLFDIFGDNVVETDGEKYYIECYLEEVKEWLNQTES